MLDVVARYAERAGVELEGGREAMRRLAVAVRAAEGVAIPLHLPEGGGANPYEGFLGNVTVFPNGDAVVIGQQDSRLLIIGSREKLGVLADNILWLADQCPPTHAHIEYHPDHYYLHASSTHLVLALRRE